MAKYKKKKAVKHPKKVKRKYSPYTNKYPKKKVGGRNFLDPQYKRWRHEVRKRDGYNCAWPGCKHKLKLETHHILRWSENLENRFNISNGITLCKYHHTLVKGKEQDYIILFNNILIAQLKEKINNEKT
jgi:hypothetical protein